MNEMLTKECNECHEDLPLYEYGYSPSRGTYFAKCRECTKNRRKKWYKKDPNISFTYWKGKEKCAPKK